MTLQELRKYITAMILLLKLEWLNLKAEKN